MNEHICLLVSIVERGKGQLVTGIANENHIHFNLAMFGHGTATSEIMDMLGLGTTEKDIIFSALPRSKAAPLMQAISERLRMRRPGTGVAFTLPLSGINELIARVILNEKGAPEASEEARGNMSTMKHWLILTVVDPGVTEQVVAAARAAGATGGTIINARGVGREIAEPFLGVSIQSEREIVAIVSEREKAPVIMQAINQAFGPNTKFKGIIFSLPVSDMIGLGIPMK